MKLNNKRTVLVGLAFLSICAFWQMYDNVVPLILTKTFHLNETFSGAIMAADNVLALFLLTGGVAKYVEHLMDHGATDRETMLRTVVDKDSVFLLEGKSLLIEEFGRDYGRYFDILKLIAEGHNSRSDLEGILGVEISGHLSRLENDYGILSKSKPLLQKSNNRNIRYHIKDHFMRFWFRFFYKYTKFLSYKPGTFKPISTIIIGI